MGGILSLFSNEPPPPSFNYSNNYNSYRREEPPPRVQPFVSNNYNSYQREEPPPRVQPFVSNNSNSYWRENSPVSVRRTPQNNQLENKFYTLTMNQCIQQCGWTSFSNEIEFVVLPTNSMEYNRIQNRFSRSLSRSNLNIIKIEKVKNYFLMGQYLSKKEEYRYKNIHFEEQHYYHGTKQVNLHSICRDNFNWRITNRNKFGKGVSFASSSSYAIHYCDKRPRNTKIMFVARVLLGKACEGYEDMPIPKNGFDASAKCDGKVIVKFYDNEFYPEYVVHFTADIIHYNKNNIQYII